MRVITVAAAQMGPNQRAESRSRVVGRMLALMDEAKARGADLIVYPELALTTFFPRWFMEDQAEVDSWFERAMPNEATARSLPAPASSGWRCRSASPS
jgi:predicted amidohydrolase